MEFSYSQTENFEMEKLSSDTGYLKKNSGDQQGDSSPQDLYTMTLVWGITKCPDFISYQSAR